jgi:DNA-binding transcriptional ArsR family regulator
MELIWDQELSAGDIAAQFEVSWSAVSQHLRVLKAAGFVVERREGTSRIYRAAFTALTRPLSGPSAPSSKITGAAAWTGSGTWPRPGNWTRTRHD